MAPFLFLMTVLIAGGLVNEGYDKCVETKGFKACAEKFVDSKQPADYSKLNS